MGWGEGWGVGWGVGWGEGGVWVGVWVGVVGSSKYLYGSVGNILAHRRAIELDTIRVDPVAGRVELEVQRALRTDRVGTRQATDNQARQRNDRVSRTLCAW